MTMTAKLPAFSKREAQEIGTALNQGPNVPVEFLNDEEHLAVVEDGYTLSGVRDRIEDTFC